MSFSFRKKYTIIILRYIICFAILVINLYTFLKKIHLPQGKSMTICNFPKTFLEKLTLDTLKSYNEVV